MVGVVGRHHPVIPASFEVLWDARRSLSSQSYSVSNSFVSSPMERIPSKFKRLANDLALFCCPCEWVKRVKEKTDKWTATRDNQLSYQAVERYTMHV